MKIKTALVLGGLCAFGGGCSPLVGVTRTGSGEPEYSRGVDVTDCKRSRKLAEVAWDQLRQANAEIEYSTDFAEGFKKGFADYLRGSTNSEPPSLPPSSYRPSDYESVQGRQAVLDWFRGFREGAVQAQASGLRPVAVVPAAIIPPTSLPPAAAAPQGPSADMLPLPARVIPPSEGDPAKQNDDQHGGPRSPL